MPDHVHFVLCLPEEGCDDGEAVAHAGGQMPAPTLGRIVGAFKTVTARAINAQRGTVGQRVWQRSYFEHVVRNEKELNNIREYIRLNPFASHKDDRDDLREAWKDGNA